MKKILIITSLLLASCGPSARMLQEENDSLKHELQTCGYMLSEAEQLIQLHEYDMGVYEQRIDSLKRIIKKK